VGTRLLTISIDAVPSLSADERLFGNILFFRNHDRDFLPSLCDWLEHSCPQQSNITAVVESSHNKDAATA
jgi:hypothetical protein